jgi:hypothetical protein
VIGWPTLVLMSGSSGNFSKESSDVSNSVFFSSRLSVSPDFLVPKSALLFHK